MSTQSAPGRQQTLTEACGGDPDTAENEPVAESMTDAPTKLVDRPDPQTEQSAPTGDRVVGEALTCRCGRPAGADGQCTAHRMETAGAAIGNHGRRL